MKVTDVKLLDIQKALEAEGIQGRSIIKIFEEWRKPEGEETQGAE